MPFPVFSTYLWSGALETTMFLVSGIKEHSRVPLFTTFQSLCSFPVTTYGDATFKVDEPNGLLDGVCKGNPFVPSKRKAMKPPWDGARDINVAQLFELKPPNSLTEGEFFLLSNPSEN